MNTPTPTCPRCGAKVVVDGTLHPSPVPGDSYWCDGSKGCASDPSRGTQADEQRRIAEALWDALHDLANWNAFAAFAERVAQARQDDPAGADDIHRTVIRGVAAAFNAPSKYTCRDCGAQADGTRQDLVCDFRWYISVDARPPTVLCSTCRRKYILSALPEEKPVLRGNPSRDPVPPTLLCGVGGNSPVSGATADATWETRTLPEGTAPDGRGWEPFSAHTPVHPSGLLVSGVHVSWRRKVVLQAATP